MKFRCFYYSNKLFDYLRAKYEEKFEWHKWFAWRPIQLAKYDCRWLEYIERRIVREEDYYHFPTDHWEYRSIK